MQGLLELAGIPYVGCGVLASAACMDKGVANALFEANDIPHTKWLAANRWQIESDLTIQHPYPERCFCIRIIQLYKEVFYEQTNDLRYIQHFISESCLCSELCFCCQPERRGRAIGRAARTRRSRLRCTNTTPLCGHSTAASPVWTRQAAASCAARSA